MKSAAAPLALLLLSTYAYFAPAAAWNESSRFDLVRSLVERRRLDIDPFHINTEDKAFRNGHYYSDKAPGAAFLAVPAYAAYHAWLRSTGAPLPQALPESAMKARAEGRPAPLPGPDEPIFVNPTFRRAIYVCNLSTNVLAGAALGVLFFLVLARSAVPAPVALLATASLAFGSPVFAYSTMFYGHVLAAAFLFAAFALLGPFFEPALPPRWTGRRLSAAGACLGLAVLCELPAALGAVALGLYVLHRLGPGQRLRGLGLVGLGAVPPLLLLGGYQLAAFGNPFSTGYSHLSNDTFARGMSRGLLGVSWPRPRALWGMLFGRSRGLLYISPVLALGFLGLGRVWRPGSHRRELVLASAVVLAFLLMSAGYYMWWGGAALGPRHVLPALPFLALGIAPALLAGDSPRVRWWAFAVAATLLLVAWVNQTAAVAVSPAAPFGGDVLRDQIYLPLWHGRVAVLSGSTNVGMLLGLRGPASLLPLLVLWLMGARAIWAAMPPPAPGPGR
jgi:hypothetical protein